MQDYICHIATNLIQEKNTKTTNPPHLHSDGAFPGVTLIFVGRNEFEGDRAVERRQNLYDLVGRSTGNGDSIDLEPSGYENGIHF